MTKKYKFGFDISGLAIFLIVMIPNFIWFAVPASNDILRYPSVTPIIDATGSVFQVLFVGAICVIISKDRKPLRFSVPIISSLICILLYFSGWILYYNGLTDLFVILLLTVPPCLAFILFAYDRNNVIAVVFAACYMICHLIYGAVNFIM